jgi:polysaccharide export outer membrane protein
MKPAFALLSFGLLSLSLSAFGQPPAPRPDPATALNPAPPSEAVPGAQPAPGMPPSEVAPTPDVIAADIEPNYILGETDSIVVNVWKEPSLTGGFTVRPDGRITLPLIGDLPAAGLSPMALAAEISDRLKKFMNDPTVTVIVTAANSRRITFIGQVGHPGPLIMTRDMTMLQAIAAVGGPTDFANKKKIYVLRDDKSKEQQRIDCEKVMAQNKPCEQPKQQKIPFDYNKALKKGDMQGVTPKPGDTVVVP